MKQTRFSMYQKYGVLVFSFFLLFTLCRYLSKSTARLTLSQCNQLFGTGRVNGHAVIKVFLGCAHLDSNAKALQNLAASNAHDVQTNNLLLRAGRNQLIVGRALVLWGHRDVVQGTEAGLVNLDVILAVLFDGFWLRETDRTNFGVGKHD